MSDIIPVDVSVTCACPNIPGIAMKKERILLWIYKDWD